MSCKNAEVEEWKKESFREEQKQERNLIFPNKKSEARIVRDEWET